MDTYRTKRLTQSGWVHLQNGNWVHAEHGTHSEEAAHAIVRASGVGAIFAASVHPETSFTSFGNL